MSTSTTKTEITQSMGIFESIGFVFRSVLNVCVTITSGANRLAKSADQAAEVLEANTTVFRDEALEKVEINRINSSKRLEELRASVNKSNDE